ncbi:MAG: hypothetical protein EBZ48_17850, partial [Proteobacteria bacterium]|nr:hypothetical protein [Pseudomonadota bacterium]
MATSAATADSGGGSKRRGLPSKLRSVIVLLAVGLAAHEYFFPEEKAKEPEYRPTVVRPRLPSSPPEGTSTQKSQKAYYNGMLAYAQDNVIGYKTAADSLLDAASYDIRNARAIAMLASSYLNLVDSSAKDENYFTVISKLVEMARAKAFDLAETVIADVEFFVTTNQPEAAENRLVEATKQGKIPDFLSAFYLGYTAYSRGDYPAAARYLNQIPDNKIPTPKMYYYRGLVAERLNDADAALLQYEKAVKQFPTHARSRLRIAEVLAKRGKLKEAAPQLDFLIKRPALLASKELALAFYLHSQLSGMFQKWNLALGDVEKSVKLDPMNRDYLLEMRRTVDRWLPKPL